MEGSSALPACGSDCNAQLTELKSNKKCSPCCMHIHKPGFGQELKYPRSHHEMCDQNAFFKKVDKIKLSKKILISQMKKIDHRPVLLEYSDPSLHQDVYQIITNVLFNVRRTAEDIELDPDKFMRIWITFFEPMFGVPPRLQDRVKHKENMGKSSDVWGGPLAHPGFMEDSAYEVDTGVDKKLSIAEKARLPRDRRLQAAYKVLAMEPGIDSTSVGSRHADHAKIGFDEYFHPGDLGLPKTIHQKIKEKVNREVNKLKAQRKVADTYLAYAADGTRQKECDRKQLANIQGSSVPLASSTVHSPRFVYGNDSIYLIFRLHHILYTRLLLAKTEAGTEAVAARVAADESRRSPEDTTEVGTEGVAADESKCRSPEDTKPPVERSYSKFIEALYNLLSGSISNTKYENQCYYITGVKCSMELSSLDRLIFKLMKWLKRVVRDDTLNELFLLNVYEKFQGDQGDQSVEELLDRIHSFASTSGDNIYRFEYTFDRSACTIHIIKAGCVG